MKYQWQEMKCLGIYIYIYGHNILRLFDVWPNFSFTKGKTKSDF